MLEQYLIGTKIENESNCGSLKIQSRGYSQTIFGPGLYQQNSYVVSHITTCKHAQVYDVGHSRPSAGWKSRAIEITWDSVSVRITVRDRVRFSVEVVQSVQGTPYCAHARPRRQYASLFLLHRIESLAIFILSRTFMIAFIIERGIVQEAHVIDDRRPRNGRCHINVNALSKLQPRRLALARPPMLHAWLLRSAAWVRVTNVRLVMATGGALCRRRVAFYYGILSQLKCRWIN